MNQHKRNIKGLIKAAQDKSQDVLQRTLEAIDKLGRENKSINFNIVAKTAQVSIPWLYRHPLIRERIEKLRSQHLKNKGLISKQNSIEIIGALKEKIKKLKHENTELRKQLEMVYGQLHKLKK